MTPLMSAVIKQVHIERAHFRAYSRLLSQNSCALLLVVDTSVLKIV